MKFTETHSSQNGYHKASPQPGEAFVVPTRPTTFPQEIIPLSLPVLLYNLSRFTWGDMWLIRFPQWTLGLGAALWAMGRLPGGWWVTTLCLALLLALFWQLRRWRQQDFVIFVAQPAPPVTPQRLDPKEKIPIHATGRFAVENKVRRFTWLPGFYRTFATREHALLCQSANRSFLGVGRWPEAEIGMWYTFFTPQVIQQLAWGELYFGKHSRPAIAVTYQLPGGNAQPRKRESTEIVYLTLPDPNDGKAILADLLADLPDSVLSPNRVALPKAQ